MFGPFMPAGGAWIDSSNGGLLQLFFVWRWLNMCMALNA